MKNIKILCNRKYNGKNNATRHCLQHERQQTHVIQTQNMWALEIDFFPI